MLRSPSVNVDLVVFFETSLVKVDLTRVLYALRCKPRPKGQRLRLRQEIDGRFLEFSAPGLHGSCLVSNTPFGAAKTQAYVQDRVADPSGYAVLQRQVALHASYLHISVSGTSQVEDAAKRILKSALGLLADAQPLAVHLSHVEQVLRPSEAYAWCGAMRPAARSKVLHSTLDHVAAQTEALALAQIAPRRVLRDASKPLRQRLGQTVWSATKLSWKTRTLQCVRNLVHTPADIVTLQKVAAGAIFGMLISGWVFSTFEADSAMATTLAYTNPLALLAEDASQ